MIKMTFAGMLLSAVEGVNAPEYGGGKFTTLEFSPDEGRVFTMRADGHLAGQVAPAIKRGVEWVLDVEPKVSQGKTSFKVVGISNGKTKS